MASFMQIFLTPFILSLIVLILDPNQFSYSRGLMISSDEQHNYYFRNNFSIQELILMNVLIIIIIIVLIPSLNYRASTTSVESTTKALISFK